MMSALYTKEERERERKDSRKKKNNTTRINEVLIKGAKKKGKLLINSILWFSQISQFNERTTQISFQKLRSFYFKCI